MWASPWLFECPQAMAANVPSVSCYAFFHLVLEVIPCHCALFQSLEGSHFVQPSFRRGRIWLHALKRGALEILWAYFEITIWVLWSRHGLPIYQPCSAACPASTAGLAYLPQHRNWGWSFARLCAWKGPMLSLMLCSFCREIFSIFWIRDPVISFCAGFSKLCNESCQSSYIFPCIWIPHNSFLFSFFLSPPPPPPPSCYQSSMTVVFFPFIFVCIAHQHIAGTQPDFSINGNWHNCKLHTTS